MARGVTEGRTVRSGYRSRQAVAARLEADFRNQELLLQQQKLARELCRLRSAARDYLTALPSDAGAALARLRNEIRLADALDRHGSA